MGVDQFNDCHCSHQEEDDVGDFTGVVQQVMVDGVMLGNIFDSLRLGLVGEPVGDAGLVEQRGGVDDEQGPAEHAGNQRRGRLVDIDRVLERDADVANREDQADCEDHVRAPSKRKRLQRMSGGRPQKFVTIFTIVPKCGCFA